MNVRRVTFPTNPWAESVREEYRAMSETCKACGEYQHATNPDCKTCGGRGHVIGGDDVRPCPSCRLRENR